MPPVTPPLPDGVDPTKDWCDLRVKDGLRYSERELLRDAQAGLPLQPWRVVVVLERLARIRRHLHEVGKV